MSRSIGFALALAVVALCGADGVAGAQPPSRNFTFRAQKNDYALAPGGQNYSAAGPTCTPTGASTR